MVMLTHYSFTNHKSFQRTHLLLADTEGRAADLEKKKSLRL